MKEGEIGVVPLRLHVADRDQEQTPAWKVKYTMEGDTGGNFKVETDPFTNDGILTVVKVRQMGGMPVIFTQPHLGRHEIEIQSVVCSLGKLSMLFIY